MVKFLHSQTKYLALLAMAVGLIACPGALATELASPAVEVKVLLKPLQVLDTNARPNDALRKAFKISKEKSKNPVMLRMQFLDGPKQDLRQNGWNIRFRKIQGQDYMELTFKRRYSVDTTLEAVLTNAADDGFTDSPANHYESELEWGYHKQTLTFSNEQRARDAEAQSLTMPSIGEARHLVADKMPSELQQWKGHGGAKGILPEACLYGPVDGWRWHGSHAEIDDKIAIEVWALPTPDQSSKEHIVEISFKKKKYDAQATVQRQKLLRFLKTKGWLMEEDVLKTKLVFERSRQSNCGH